MPDLSALLSPIDVHLDQLLLDPNNPRFAELGEPSEPKPETRIAEERVQKEALAQMKSPRLDLIELRDTIKTVGYLPMDRIVVRPWGGNREDATEKYVVVEGNRRVAALLWLMELHNSAKETFTQEQLSNFNSIPALLLDVDRAPQSTLLVLPGLRHVSGVKSWGAYQQAKAVYDLRHSGIPGQEAAQSLGLSTRMANQLWRSYLALEQMRNDDEYGELTEPRLYSYFEEIMKLPNVRNWLGWNDSEGRFAEEARTKELYSWMLGEPAEDGDEENRGEKKLPEARSVRQLGKFIDDERALAIFRSAEGNLTRALSRYEAEHQAAWQGNIADTETVLAALTPDILRAMSETDIGLLKSLYDRISRVLADRDRLVSI